eukprot:NODE_16193_length_1007_cov_6.011364.p6 GENE.NODE_16193_length_1007_cov_6.011364~~NODE_16193_length_1007_cov_6.011364.p6  ORF type:complete len:58 (-),score=7.25 NODE_16193_length_1007_cov_6.011364:356-529(-)
MRQNAAWNAHVVATGTAIGAGRAPPRAHMPPPPSAWEARRHFGGLRPCHGGWRCQEV